MFMLSKKIMFAAAYTLIGAALLTQTSCKKDENIAAETTQPTETVGVDARQQVITEYEQVYLGSNVATVGWTGKKETCAPGTVAAGVNDKVMQRINYYRKMVGLPPCTHDNALAVFAQKAALIMHSNNMLSHNPTNTWVCYSADGRDGAMNSNLAMGVVASDAVDAFMVDNGSGNTAVGHRRWLLFSRAKTFGYGSTNTYSAIYALHNSKNAAATNLPAFIAYPPKGNIVQDHFRANMRWSFSVPNANFSSAVVTVKNEAGANIPVTKELIAGGYGDNTLVFVPAIAALPLKDTKYFVSINGVNIGTTPKNYLYEVNWVKR
jgi:uncharacterized protein YkwD